MAAVTDFHFSLTSSPENLAAGQTRSSVHSFPFSVPLGSCRSLYEESSPASVNATLKLHVLQHQPSGRAIEDRFSVHILPVTGSSNVKVLLGVYDGHRGPWAADYVARSLPSELLAVLSRLESKHGNVRSDSTVAAISEQHHHRQRACQANVEIQTVFGRLDRRILSAFQDVHRLPLSTWAKIRYLTHSFKPKSLADVNREERSSHGHAQTETSKASCALQALSGCTASLLYLNISVDSSQLPSAKLFNLGDSRTVIASLSSGTILASTTDVNSSTPHEKSLILSQHPTDDPDDIFVGSRLFGETLSTRGFGDAIYKLPMRPATTAETYPNLTQAEQKLHKHLVDQLSAYETAARLGMGAAKVITLTDRYTAMFSHYKSPPYVSPIPDIIETSLANDINIKGDSQSGFSRESLFAILATDGLWDLVSSEEAVEIIRDAILQMPFTGQNEENLAKILLDQVTETKDRKIGDDVTIIVLVIKLP